MCSSAVKFHDLRQSVTNLALRSLQDRSSNVRRYAIKLLSKLVETHPFIFLHGGQLRQSEWLSRLEALNVYLGGLRGPSNSPPGLGEDLDVDENRISLSVAKSGDDDFTHLALIANLKSCQSTLQESDLKTLSPEELKRLQLTKRYYTEALTFISSLHLGCDSVIHLLNSKNKSEVIEAMDFLVVMDAYGLEKSKVCSNSNFNDDVARYTENASFNLDERK